MYIHLGADVVVNQKSIVGIFNLETASISKITKEYLKTAQKKGQVINVSEDLPTSFVVCKNQNKTVVYTAQISSATLFKRANFINNISIK
jgi:regulator of extracellular matrix RemA (YlzA/DUF370 family)